jgi:hypothetical protein
VANIAQRIALEGAPEINAAFAEITKAGVEAFESLRSAAKDIGLDKDLTPQLDRAKKAASDFGDGFKKTFRSIGEAVNDFANASAKITASVTGVAAALFGLAAAGSKTAHEIEQAALRTGQSADEYQRLAFGFKETSVEAGELTRAFAKISQEASKATQEGKQSTGAFEKYGIALRGADGHARSITAILSDVADKMQTLATPTERAGLAAELFGARVGTKMVGLLSQGSAGMKAMAADAERLGIVLGEHDIEAGHAFEQGMVRLGGTLDATRVKIGLAFAPAFTAAINAFADAFGRLQPAIVGVAHTIAEALAPYIKDLAALLIGNAQQIQTGFFQVLYAAFTGLAGVVRGVVMPVIQGWIAILGQVGAVVDSIFGTGFTQRFQSGAAGAIALAVAFGTLLKSAQLLAGGFAVMLRIAGLGAALSPVGLAIVAIAAAVGLLVVALSHVDWGKFAQAAQAAWDAITQGAKGLIDGLLTTFGEWFDWLKQKIDDAVQWFAKLFGLAGAPGQGASALAGAAAGGVATAAGGGFVTGPGTSTSDSIPARLSHGEYVQRAAAVSHYGVGFMHAINALKFPRFALGGLVDRIALSLPPLRFAQGGAVPQASSVVNLSLDGRHFDGLRAPAGVAQSLRAYAVTRQTASTGRKPSWLR